MKKLSPLAGIKVLDFTRILAGPYCSMILGDLGAEIFKIERPKTGDDTRQWYPPSVNGESSYFFCVNRNKRSVVLNMKSKKGQSLAKQLALKSDMILENFLPGTMDRYGLSYEALQTLAPRLIYCSITGYGSDGPYKSRGGFDVIAAAIGGFLHITGPEDGEPCKAGVAVTDLLTGLYAHGAIMAALLHREKTGKGQHIDCNLLSTQIASLVNIGSNYLNCGQEARRLGTAHESIVPYQAFRTSDDRWIVIGATNEKQFAELCARLDLGDLRQNPKFKTNADRVRSRKELLEILKTRFLAKTLAGWKTVFEGTSLPFGPVNNLEDAFSDPQVVHNGLIEEIAHPVSGRIRMAGPPVKYSDSDNRLRSHPPVLGEHTAEVLAKELGLNENEIGDLLRDGVIETSSKIAAKL